MPLRVWLPLDNNYVNQGIDASVVAEGGVFETPGKTSAYCWRSSSRISVPYKYASTDKLSVCMWVKPNGALAWTSMFGWGNTSTRRNRIEIGSNAGSTYWFFGSNDCLIPSNTAITTSIPDLTWTHFAMVADGANVKFYVNGALVESVAQRSQVSATFDGHDAFYFGGYSDTYNGYYNDVRIYDHALSTKEVYEISRALIIHYPLNAPWNANSNLLTWSNNYTKTTPYVHTSSARDGYKYLGNDSLITVTPGKTYYVQLKSDGIPSDVHSGHDGTVTNKFTLWFYIRKIGTTKAIGSYDSTACFMSTNIYKNGQVNHLYVWKWKAPSNAQDITLRTNSYSDGTTAVTLKFWDFKIEEDTYTAYVPSKNSAQYTELGYGIGIVRDTTGRGNDGQLYTTAPTFVSGSPRYATCASFASGSCIWPIPDPIKSTTTEFTISVWFRTTTVSGNQCIWNGRTTTGAAVGIFLIGSGIRVDDSNQTASVSVAVNTWYHLVVTWKSGGSKVIYLNGEQKTSAAAGTLSKSNTNASIGRSSTGNTLATSNYFSGQMSDFRIYGTALTADDVKYLYATSAAIDNNGDMFASSFEEIENAPSIAKNGLVYGSHFTESGGTQRLFSAFNGTPVYPNSPPRTFTPTTAQNSTVAWYFFECIPGIQTYHITMRVDWSGFEDITTTNPTFDAWFQGTARRTDGSGNEWTASSFTTALNNHKRLGTLAKGSASGTYLYDMDFTLSSYYPSEYIGQQLGMRSDYSNGTGTFSISDIRIYPVTEHKTNAASLCSNGAIQVRLLDESA